MNEIITLTEWHTPATDYPRKKKGTAEIAEVRYRGLYHNYMQRGHEFFETIRKGIPITILRIEGQTWMVDDPPHWWAMEDHASTFRGHVLCAGLGLGLIAHTLSENDAVEKVTIVERNVDVIRLVKPLIPHEKIEVVHDDWWEFETADHVDGVLFDLLVGNAHEMHNEALGATIDALDRFGDHISVRVHGFANPLMEHAARLLRLPR